MIRVVYIDPNHVHGQTGHDQWFIGYTGPPTRKPSEVSVATQSYGWLQHVPNIDTITSLDIALTTQEYGWLQYNPSVDVSLPLNSVLEEDGITPVLEQSGEVVIEE